MDIIKILYANFLQEKSEKEFALQLLLNSPSNILTQVEDCKKIIIEISNLNNAIGLLDAMIVKEK